MLRAALPLVVLSFGHWSCSGELIGGPLDAGDGPVGVQDGPVGAQDGPVGAQDGPVGAQDGPRLDGPDHPDGPKDGPDVDGPAPDLKSPPDAKPAPDVGSDVGSDVAPDAPAPPAIGPQPVPSTPLAQGTIFVAPGGSGSTCSASSPCSLWTGVSKAVAGDVVFLRGGVYKVSQSVKLSSKGSPTNPITVESYPNEKAILDGSAQSAGSNIHVTMSGSWYALRNIEIRNMPQQGLYIGGTDNLIEGLHVHHNKLSGIQVYSPYDKFPYGAFGSRNTIRHCTVHDNSDAGLTGGGFANGGNADGIGLSSGEANKVLNCLVYHNSDDGIDTWRATNSYVGYSSSHSNGIASGDGNGFKAGGLSPSQGTIVEHCITYGNKANGFDFNGGKQVQFRYNTAYNNGSWAYVTGSDTVVAHCIAVQQNGKLKTSSGIFTDNSWQRSGSVAFVSTTAGAAGFLQPVPGGGFDDIGAYAKKP